MGGIILFFKHLWRYVRLRECGYSYERWKMNERFQKVLTVMVLGTLLVASCSRPAEPPASPVTPAAQVEPEAPAAAPAPVEVAEAPKPAPPAPVKKAPVTRPE